MVFVGDNLTATKRKKQQKESRTIVLYEIK